jgi:uncharacterized membrane protein
MNYASIIGKLVEFLDETIVPILIGLTVVYFLYGVMKFVKSAGDQKARDEAKNTIMYGLIGLAVMVTVWGLVAIIANSLTGDSNIGIPQLKI